MASDYKSEALRSQNMQMLAKILAGQGQQPQGQMVSGRFVAPSWTQNLGALGAQLGTGYAINKSGEAATNSETLRRQAVAEALAGYQARPDQMAGWSEASASDLPEVAKVGEGRVKAINDAIKDNADPTSGLKAVLSGTYTDIKPKKETASAGDRVWDINNPGSPLIDARPQYGPLEHIDNATVQKEDGTGKYNQVISRPPTTTVSIGNNILEKAVPKVMDALEAARGQVLSSRQMKATVARMQPLLDDPKVITGALQGPRADIANVAQLLFPGDVQGLDKTQALMQESANLSLDAASRMAKQGQITESERVLLKDAAGGKLDYTAPTIKKILATTAKVADWQERNAQQYINNVGTNKDLKPLSDLYGEGSVTSPSSAPTGDPSHTVTNWPGQQ